MFWFPLKVPSNSVIMLYMYGFMEVSYTYHSEGLDTAIVHGLGHQRQSDMLRNLDAPTIKVHDDHVQLGQTTMYDQHM